MKEDFPKLLRGAGVISYDAGGAEILSSMISESELDVPFWVDGPAKGIFERRLGGAQLESSVMGITHLLGECEWVVSSVGWQTDFEWNAIRQSLISGKKTVVLLDHWVNYRERLERNDISLIPDEFWAPDQTAQRIVASLFPQVPTVVVGNPYLDEAVRVLKAMASPPSHLNTALYLGENISEHSDLDGTYAEPFGYTEVEAFNYFLSYALEWVPRVDKIIVRPHPSESSGKYTASDPTYPIPIEHSHEQSLVSDIGRSHLVVGCESMAMVVALAAGKGVWCCIPPWGRASRLPFMGIRNLAEWLGPESR